jgi:hypothetical protein
MGEGGSVTCGPGTAYTFQNTSQTPSCSYTYLSPSASRPGGTYTVSATILWHATWTAAGAPGGGNLGTIRRTASTQITVGEAEALNTNPSP